MTTDLHDTVRKHYARLALEVIDRKGCGPDAAGCGPDAAGCGTEAACCHTNAACCGEGAGCCGASSQTACSGIEAACRGTEAACCHTDAACCAAIDYTAADLAGLPEAARLASLGCGNPIAVAELHEGERVLDLGSGGGIDVLLSAKRVGPGGRAFGLDMTDEMLALARRNAAEAGTTNVEFFKGRIEAIPLPADSIDVVISNCVINLAADKAAVFREIARVLRPGGRLGVADMVADDALSAGDRAERGSYVGCIAGALSFAEYEVGLRKAGFVDVSITPAHEETAGISSAIIRATKPES